VVSQYLAQRFGVLGKLPHRHQRDTHGGAGEYETRCVHGWSGGGCPGPTPTCTIALSSNQSVQAMFEKRHQPKPQVSAAVAGFPTDLRQSGRRHRKCGLPRNGDSAWLPKTYGVGRGDAMMAVSAQHLLTSALECVVALPFFALGPH
jgi:hypothetical protein